MLAATVAEANSPPVSSWAAEDRFQERMRRRTLRALEDPNKQEEARRAGQLAADVALMRASALLLSQSHSQSHTEPHRADVFRSAVQPSSLAASALLATIPSSSFETSVDGSSCDGDGDGDGYESADAGRERKASAAAPASAATAERAVRRGSRRGVREPSERELSLGGGGSSDRRLVVSPPSPATDCGPYDSFRAGGNRRRHNSSGSHGSFASSSDVDMTTITTDAFTDFTTKNSKKSQLRARATQAASSKRKKGSPKWGKGWLPAYRPGGGSDDDGECDDDLLGGIGNSAWMCGVCGQAFSSLQSAERHEDWHLRHVVTSLGWADDSTNLNFLKSPDAATTAASAAVNAATNALLDRSSRGGAASLRASSSFAARRPRFDSSDSVPPTAQGQPRRRRTFSGNGTTLREDRFYSFRDVDGEEEKAEEVPPQAATSMVPRRRSRAMSGSSEVRFWDSAAPDRRRLSDDGPLPLLPSQAQRDYVVLADEALLDVCRRAAPMVLTPAELKAERHLSFLARDKRHYDDLVARALARRTNPTNRFRSDADTVRGKVVNKLLDAYQLMKEGDRLGGHTKDRYQGKVGGGGGAAGADEALLPHTPETLYVNVLVRNGVQVVRRELERLAREKWEHPDMAEKYTRFERFRAYAHTNMVKLAGLALASDFTPRRIAIQLSNDLYRLLTPRLKRRGVTIGTEIEYRVGGYFVLAVNINTIDWARLIKTSNRDLRTRKAKWKRDGRQHEDEEEVRAGRWHLLVVLLASFRRLLSLSKYDVVDQVLSFLYRFHWIVYLPLCKIAYRSPGIGSAIREFIISSAIDEICYYVHEKGMEMEIRVCRAENQASFMLSALREIRADGRELQKKRQETEAQEMGTILGPLLGPAIKADKDPAVEPPGFEVPPNLEYVGLELDLPVGFRRLRWAYLSRQSSFVTEALWKTESKYENITIGDWSKHSDLIGDPNPPPTVNTDDFIGAEFEASYLMPKSAFVSANMSYATSQLIAYNDYCFCVKTRSRNPDAPFGSTFVAWTQFLVIDTGNNSCKLICSVEAEFPNGPPMVARQIQSGMRAGTGESFILTGETIAKYANAYP